MIKNSAAYLHTVHTPVHISGLIVTKLDNSDGNNSGTSYIKFIIKLVTDHWFPLLIVDFCIPFAFQATFPVPSSTSSFPVRVMATSQRRVLFNDVMTLVMGHWFPLNAHDCDL